MRARAPQAPTADDWPALAETEMPSLTEVLGPPIKFEGILSLAELLGSMSLAEVCVPLTGALDSNLVATCAALDAHGVIFNRRRW